MTITTFPSGNDVGGGKTVKEIYWAPLNELIVAKSFVYSGYTVPTDVPGSMILPISAGKAVIKTTLGAYYVGNSAVANIELTNGTRNYVYIKLTLDGNDKVLTAAPFANTTGILPDNSIPICSALVSGGAILSTIDLRVPWTWRGTGGHAHTGLDGEGSKVSFPDILGTIDESQLPVDLDGISADMVDGMHANEFSVYNHNHDAAYVNVTGDTMSGDLVIDKYIPSFTLTGSGNAVIDIGNSFSTGTSPRIDFHFGMGTDQDYNVRIVNSANKVLDIVGPTFDVALKLNGIKVLVEGETVVGSDTLDGYHADAFVLKAGSTMTGDLGMEYYGTTRKIIFKSQGTSKWGIFAHATQMGFADWANSRNPFIYNTVTGAVSLGTPAGGIDLYSSSAELVFVHVGASSFKLWNGGNDGSGSGLDADTLDGKHGPDFCNTGTNVVISNCAISGHVSINVAAGPSGMDFSIANSAISGIVGFNDGMRCLDYANVRDIWTYSCSAMSFIFNHAHHHFIGPWYIHHGGHLRWSWCSESGTHWRGFEHFDHGIRCHDWDKNRDVWTYDADALTFVFNSNHTHYIGTDPIWHAGNLSTLYAYLDARYVLQ
jgi:hypothetical protein